MIFSSILSKSNEGFPLIRPNYINPYCRGEYVREGSVEGWWDSEKNLTISTPSETSLCFKDNLTTGGKNPTVEDPSSNLSYFGDTQGNPTIYTSGDCKFLVNMGIELRMGPLPTGLRTLFFFC